MFVGEKLLEKEHEDQALEVPRHVRAVVPPLISRSLTVDEVIRLLRLEPLVLGA